jgi:hypothetical protein
VSPRTAVSSRDCAWPYGIAAASRRRLFSQLPRGDAIVAQFALATLDVQRARDVDAERGEDDRPP